ncbi:MAG: OmpH family outer membrane protein [Sphingobacteriaceae bacterium]|nr:MAG: OmpH family outer membrane protein [Sphingobacteriaceae bacterium]
MRKLLKVALVALGVVFMSNFAQAQVKIGYVSIDEVVPLLPEFKTAQTLLNKAQEDWMTQINKLGTEAQNKAKEYQAKSATMSDAVRSSAESELQELNRRITEQQDKAKADLDAKSAAQMAPLVTKVKTAIAAVAKEKGYTHVINATTNDLFLVAPPADDLLAAVKTKLGIK